ncbi:MAG: CPBP family intramembrane metalloprotease [Planctomycetales bacterium]|nr:CPBP family intramembrane metalloprotease [Planctomycetales bacterium]
MTPPAENDINDRRTDEQDAATRAGRAVDWLLVAAALALPSLVTWLYFVALAASPPALQQTAYAVGKGLQFALPLAWVLLVQRRRPRFRAPTPREAFMGLASGALIAAAMAALYLGWLKPAGLFDRAIEPILAKVSGIGIDSGWKYFAVAIFYAVVHSLLEEYYWRWCVFGQLQTLAGFWIAAAVSSAGFMAHHVLLLGVYFGYASWLTWAMSACIAVGGAIWAAMYARRGTLWAPWLSHLAVDAMIFAIGWEIVGPSL